MMHLIFVYDNDSRYHTTKCIAQWTSMTLMVTHLLSFHLPLYLFLLIRMEVQATMSSGLPYGVMLTRFLMGTGVPVLGDEPILRQLHLINGVKA